MKILTALRIFLRRLRHDDRGAVTLTFLLVSTLMLGGAFGAIDLVRHNVAQGRLQNSLDAAVISAGRNLANRTPTPGTPEHDAWMSDARNFFRSNMPDGYMGSTVSTADLQITYSEEHSGAYLTGQFVDMSVHGDLPLISTGFMKITSFPLGASNQAVRRTRNDMEVVMALDNSGSMEWDNPRRIDVLKDAAKDLTATVLGASNVPGGSQNVYIGLVPFTDVVNVKDYALDGGWLDYPSTQHNYIERLWRGCIAEPAPAGNADWFSTNPLPAEALSPNAPFRPLHLTYSFDYSPLPGGAVFVGENPIDFRTRTLNRDRRISAVQISNTRIRINVAIDPEYCLDGKVRFLSNDETAIGQAIDAMEPYGGTGVPVGLQWAWRMLHPNWQGAWGVADMPRDPERESLSKVIVLLSDGENAPVSDGRRRAASATSDRRFDFDITYRYFRTWTEQRCVERFFGFCIRWETTEHSEEREETRTVDQTPDRFYQCPAAGLRVLNPLNATPDDVDRSSSGCNHARNSIGYGNSNRQDGDAYDAYMAQLCHNVKNDGNEIKLYTVTLGSNVPQNARDLMRQCASGPSYYFNAQNVNDLPEVFASIAGALTELRLTE